MGNGFIKNGLLSYIKHFFNYLVSVTAKLKEARIVCFSGRNIVFISVPLYCNHQLNDYYQIAIILTRNGSSEH